MQFDQPTAADLQDPDRRWLDQLSGRRNFDPPSFMGFVNDLIERDDWQGLFTDLPNGAGFVAKLSDFFARHRGGLVGGDGRYPYFHPLDRNALASDRLTQLLRQHVAELARIAGHADAHGLQDRLSSLTTVWIDEHGERNPVSEHSGDLDIEVYETVGDFLEDGVDLRPHWFDCLREACYAMAANYDLQRYLMADFYRFGDVILDVPTDSRYGEG